jgi:Na+-translocating ferredoxin:NAD+ oxidoreductase RnfG subunit
MSFRCIKNSAGAVAVLGLLLSVFMVASASFAGGAATIVIDKHQLAPRGSHIPDRRVKQVLKKVKEHKAMMEKKKENQKDDQLKENKLPIPQSSDKK